MLESSAGNDQSVQRTTCAICGRSVVFTIVNSVVRAVVCGELKSTSKYGSSSVAAGAADAMSHVSSLFVDVGRSPLLNVAFGATRPTPAKAEPATRRTAISTMSFFISFSYTSNVEFLLGTGSPSVDDTITSRVRFDLSVFISAFQKFRYTVWRFIRQVNT